MKTKYVLAGIAPLAIGVAVPQPAEARSDAPSSTIGASAAAACSFNVLMQVEASIPSKVSSTKIHHRGTWRQSPLYCVTPIGKVSAQRKVCGFWGCNYESKKSSGEVSLKSSPITRVIYQNCISGTHRYRTISSIQTASATPGGLAWNYRSVEGAKNPEFTC